MICVKSKCFIVTLERRRWPPPPPAAEEEEEEEEEEKAGGKVGDGGMGGRAPELDEVVVELFGTEPENFLFGPVFAEKEEEGEEGTEEPSKG